MMKHWTKLLPFFIVEWIAKKYGERWWDQQTKRWYVSPYKGVRLFFRSKNEKD